MSHTIHNLSGGQRRTDFFLMDVTTPSSIKVVQEDGTTVATTPAHKLFSLTEIVSTGFEFQDNGTANTSYSQYEDTPELYEFLETVKADPTTLTGAGDFTLEDGTLKGGATSGSKTLLAISYGAQTGATVTDVMKVTVYICNMTAGSGSFSQVADDWSQPTFEAVGVKLPGNLTVVDTLFDASTLNIDPDAVTFVAGEGYKVKFFDKVIS